MKKILKNGFCLIVAVMLGFLVWNNSAELKVKAEELRDWWSDFKSFREEPSYNEEDEKTIVKDHDVEVVFDEKCKELQLSVICVPVTGSSKISDDGELHKWIESHSETIADLSVWEYDNKSITFGYTGNVRVMADLSKADPIVRGNEISIKLPREDEWDFVSEVKVDEVNENQGIFNRISNKDRLSIQGKADKDAIDKVKDAGAVKEAENSYKEQIENMLSCFEGYTVVFR